MSFLLFISRKAEMASYRARYPNETFQFVSFHPVDQDVMVIDRNQPEAAFAEIKQMHARRPFSGVLNIREKYVRTAAALAACLGLPAFVRDAELARDKWKQRLRLSGSGQVQAAYLIREPGDLAAVPDAFFPCVLKPRFGFNSRSVTLVQNPAVLKASFLRNRNYYRRMKNEDTSNLDFVVEPFFSGSEHTLEAFVQAGKIAFSILSDKEAMPAPYFIETGDFMPSRLPEKTQAVLRRTAQNAVTALGIEFGWSHIEMKWDGQRAVVIEAAARMGGGYFGEMIQEAYGLDRFQVLMDAMLGRTLVFPEKPLVAVKGHRVVGMGLTWAGSNKKISRALAGSGCIKLVWPETPGQIKRTAVGPPFGYKNTLFEYFVIHPDPTEAEKIFRETQPQLEPRQWRVSGWLGRMVWGIFLFLTRLKRTGWIDV